MGRSGGVPEAGINRCGEVKQVTLELGFGSVATGHEKGRSAPQLAASSTAHKRVVQD